MLKLVNSDVHRTPWPGAGSAEPPRVESGASGVEPMIDRLRDRLEPLNVSQTS